MMFKNDIKYLGFNDFWFMIIGILTLGFLIPQIFFGVKIFSPEDNFPVEWLEAIMYTAIYWTLNRYIMISYRKKYPAFEDSKNRITYAVLTSVVAITLVSILLKLFFTYFFQTLPVSLKKTHEGIQEIGASYTATFFILAIYESIWYYNQLKKSIQESEQIKVAHLQSQLDGLRNQVNPHFLFNSLNTLNHIVTNEEKQTAKNFINQLSKVYRYILDSREETTIELEEELEFVEAYIAIQKERFLNNLHVNIEIPKQYFYKKIIPLSLQLLVENAIKHNIISTKKQLTIIIGIDEVSQTIFVKNNLQKKSTVMNSTKVGLENIKERYRLFSKSNQVKVEKTETGFRVSIPLLK